MGAQEEQDKHQEREGITVAIDADQAPDDGTAREKEPQEPPPDPHTSLTRAQLRRLQLLLGIAAITSPLTATIYFPLLPLLRVHFGVSAQAINLTLTVYIIFQGLSPLVFGPLSDVRGRRPLFLLTLLLYGAGNLGLALNRSSFAALLALRALQSLGASAAYAIAFGVVADVSPPAERGRMLGPIGMALNLGACVGPAAGGAVAWRSGGYEWVFWALVVVGAALLAGVGLFLPETARSRVGNGADAARFRWWQLSWVRLARRYFEEGSEGIPGKAGNRDGEKPPRYGIEHLLASLRILFYRDTALALWVHGSFYVVDYAYVAALPDIYRGYGWTELGIGLAYLPRGAGILVGSYCTGKLLDRNWRATAAAAAREHATSSPSTASFPIEQARTRFSYPLLLLAAAATVAYGWAVRLRAHPAAPLALHFLQGAYGTGFYTTYSALVVDGFPRAPGAAAAATSVVRCAMAAAGTAVLDPVLRRAGYGWYFTVLGIWVGGCGAAAVAGLRWKGAGWRRAREADGGQDG
ncbi:major facilitator superfamily domain-containing protein [Xylariomycetidae sp. FL0641]|nr:major facilitator superfamily domain-containing protein [Xylariomycetidae sp. FL0641]